MNTFERAYSRREGGCEGGRERERERKDLAIQFNRLKKGKNGKQSYNKNVLDSETQV